MTSGSGDLKVYSNLPICDNSCLTCSANTDQDCTSCQAPKLLTGATVGACVVCASDQYFDDSVEPYVCTDCHSDCLTCSGGGDSQCSTCPGLKQLTKIAAPAGCIECTSSQFFDNSGPTYVCTDCHSDCLTCSGSLPNECTSCTSPTVLF